MRALLYVRTAWAKAQRQRNSLPQHGNSRREPIRPEQRNQCRKCLLKTQNCPKLFLGKQL